MRDSSCKWNECDSYCHPTLCGIKLYLQQCHDNNLDSIGNSDLASYICYMDVACDRCDNCGYEKNDYSIDFSLEDFRHPKDIILPEPIESYKLGRELKRANLIVRKKALEEKLKNIAEDFKAEFNEDIEQVVKDE